MVVVVVLFLNNKIFLIKSMEQKGTGTGGKGIYLLFEGFAEGG